MRVVPILLLAAFSAFAAEPKTRTLDLAPLARWIEKHSSIKSIEADVTQTRSLPALRNPVGADGKFWYVAPAKFRWQIGDPPRTLAIGNGAHLTVIDTRRRTATRTNLSASEAATDVDALGMFEFPFAATFAEFREKFEVRDIQLDGSVCRVEMLPRNTAARRHLSRIVLQFDTESGHLLAFEAVTKDGSSLRNEFRNVRLDHRIDPALFEVDTTGYDVKDAPR